MPSAAVGGDTQVFDLDSPRSDSGCGDGDRFLAGDRLPNDYEETERLYDSGEDDAVGSEDWGETQVLDDFEETSFPEGVDVEVGPMTERTELPRDVEMLVDGFGGEGRSGVGIEDGKLVDADDSTDGEECGSGGPDVRSFGFDAAPGRTESSESNLVEEIYKQNHGKAENNQIEMNSNKMDAFLSSESDPNCVGTKDNVIFLDHDTENSMDIMCSRTNEFKTRLTKPAVKNRCSENIHFQDEETTKRSDVDNWELSSHAVHCVESATGLSYISSQEPGIQSQANALCVVDEFLFENDLGLSQVDNNGKASILKSPPTANLKRSQVFASMSYRSSNRKLQAYEWIDSLENEGGCELFNKKKCSFFGDKGVKPCLHDLSSVIKLGDPEVVIADTNKSNAEGIKSGALQNLTLTCSASHLNNLDAKRHILEVRSEKKIFSEMNKQSVLELEHLDRSEVDNTAGFYDIGPATQMAAEAIQALCCGSIEYEGLNPTSNNGKSAASNVGKSKKTRLKNIPKQKIGYRSPNAENNMKHSKHQQSVHSKSRAKRCNSFKKESTDLRMNGILEESVVGMTTKMKMKKKSEEICETVSMQENRNFATSVDGEVAQNVIDGSIGQIVKPPILMTPSRQPSANETCNVRTSKVYTSPIACRTRHSKAVKLSKLQTIDHRNNASIFEVCERGTTKTVDELGSNASEASDAHECSTSFKKAVPDIRSSSHAGTRYKARMNTETGVSHDKDTDRKPKRRKMDHIVLKNKVCISKMYSSSKLVDVVSPNVVNTSFKKIKNGILIRSIAEILDTARRKKRSVSSSNKFKSKELASNVGKTQKTSGIMLRSSMLTDLLNPYIANDSHFRVQQNKLAFERTTCSVSAMKPSVDPDSDKAGDSRSRLLAEVVLEKTKSNGLSNGEGQSSLLVFGYAGQPKGSHNGKGQPMLEGLLSGKEISNLSCSPKMDTNTISPIYVSQDTSLLSCAKSLSKSSRELIQLEANEITKKWKLKDMRKRKDMSSFLVCFSQHLGAEVIKQQKKILSRLGIQVVSSSLEATHFVADKFVRTRNMLEAIAMGKPVVTPMWLESCGQASCYIDEKNYILRDAKKEKEICFNMPNSLARAHQYPLLQGRSVFITPRTKPNQDLIYSLVTAAQGQPLKQLGRFMAKEDKLPDDLLILSSEEDFAACVPYLEKGAAVFSSELLLNGIVVQKLEFARHRLFLDQVKKTRSTLWLRGNDGEQFLPVKKCRLA
ncbi:hypothetical protein HPP92_016253 [Vanilla planifolia]|uniref:BRCT domain-containing protein n=1 Tax=Vanilla planifolia TaxID=51239 RepID=A0A835QMS1_VANPL|nr:hypothetical protein HPP92_016253 [Vanilla planifolia]